MSYNYLIRQANSHRYLKGRKYRLWVSNPTEKIKYKAPNGMVFYIHTKQIKTGGTPEVYNEQASMLPSSHDTHVFKKGEVCLAKSIRGWNLNRILYYCDAWSRGFEIFLQSGSFPSHPSITFRLSKFYN